MRYLLTILLLLPFIEIYFLIVIGGWIGAINTILLILLSGLSGLYLLRNQGIKTLINAGVKIIVQPGGSIRDKEVIKAANKAKIKMIFTGVRHFNH